MKKLDRKKIGLRIKEIRGSLTQAKFAEKVGVKQGYITKYEKGVLPEPDTLLKIVEFGGVSYDWLLIGKGPRDRQERKLPVKKPEISEYAYIPLYDVKASAGGGTLVENEAVKDILAFKREWIHSELRATPAEILLLFVEGESMSPALNPGDIILIRKQDDSPIRDGIYVIRLEGALLTKRLQHLPGNMIKISSDNPAYEPFTINLADSGKDFSIIGRVVWAGRKM